MKTTVSISAVLVLTGSGVAAAATDFVDTAQVVSATPIVERIAEQRQECVPVAAAPAPARDRSLVGPIVGGVAGGVLGSQVGRGSGRTAATAAGAIAGTIIGDRVGNAEADRVATTQPTQQCRLVDSYRDVVRGYTVIYRYNGRDVTTTLPYHPGSTVRVAIGVADGPGTPLAQPGTTNTIPVREVSTSAPPPPPPAYSPPPPPPTSGGYQYRY